MNLNEGKYSFGVYFYNSKVQEMKVYNPKDWIRVIFATHHSIVFSQMNRLFFAISLYTLMIVYIEKDWLHLLDSNPLKNTVVLQSLLGFSISILLVFRTNTAYDRWWEGRKLWGSLVNNSRNLAMKINALFPNNAVVREYYKLCIPFFARALTAHLTSENTRLMLDEAEHPELSIDSSTHIPNQLSSAMISKSIELKRAGKLTEIELLYVMPELNAFADVCGACERIKNTPIPYSYSAFIKKIVFFYILSLPFSLSFSIGYLTVPVVAMVAYVLIGLELVAEEIEDPFGLDENDLPMEKIASNIDKHVSEILSL